MGDEQVPMRELNQDTASVMKRVEQGHALEITNRGKVVARITPVGSELDDLVAAGWITPATNPRPFVAPEGEIEPGADAAALIRQMRDEERT
ncbi:prevent-host-death family protein [Herbihabitans rhizosphaerae]|uniref:Antitoxin n=1 Tax=Herbihabitans rhizosphaerae TaxID=1872711 RepID=A0A4Q7KLP7_9PSEU|nr:type II toxin-antitoxin system prevent-host-death family antitoxin [Herbihabitans rhizosphaerae]RZS37196.1 prevent-host-death family protein [Herbihabitans rhizosphaerae]